MAKSCPRDLIRAVVERTLEGDALGDASDVALAEEHLERCGSCRAFKARLERDERAVRGAMRSAGADPGECPSPGELAAFAEGGLEGSRRERVEEHLVACELCRDVSTVSSVVASVPPDVLSEERLASALGRLPGDRACAQPRGAASESARRATSARRRAVIRPVEPTSRAPGGAVAAAVILFLVAGGLVAVATSDRRAPAPTPTATHSATGAAAGVPVEPAPKPPAASPPPVLDRTPPPPETASDDPLPPEDDVVADAKVPGPPPQEPDPETPAPDRTAPSAPAPSPAPTTTRPVAPIGPQPAELACAVETFTGPLEIRKREARNWRRLVLTDVVQEGDGLRSRGEDGCLTLAARGKIVLAADAVATTAVTRSCVRVRLEGGSVEGESFAYNGLEIEDRNGVVTVWQGAKVRVDATEQGLRVNVTEGRAWVSNTHGRTVVRAGQELVLVADRRPAAPYARKR